MRKRIGKTTAGLFACIVLFSAIAALAQDQPQLDVYDEVFGWPQPDFTGQTTYQVARVVDGDTVVLLIDGKETKVRLIGVDTPETVHPQKPVEAYGKEASRFTENLLKGESVYLEYEAGASKLDKYGRTLAYLYRAPDGLFVNLEIVRQGYGHAYTVYPFKHMELFREYEHKAREVEKGLWAPQPPSLLEQVRQEMLQEQAPPERQTDTEVKQQPRAKETPEAVVYITKTGTKYHLDGCRYLARSKIPISLKEAKERGYRPCSVCGPPR